VVTSDQHASSAAYALNALPADERASFEEHLQQCDACRLDVAELTAAAAQMGAAEATSAPTALREAVLRRLPTTPQIQPAAHGRWQPRSSFGILLAAAAVLAVVVAGVAVSQRERPSELTAQEQLAQVLAAPDSVAVHNQVGRPAALTVVASRRLDRAVVIVDNLPELDADHTYQMWLIDKEGPQSDGLMGRAPPDQPATVLLETIEDVSQVAITVEPKGGSKAPTTKPVAGASLA
jgi:anti-sigma-K factor RskA